MRYQLDSTISAAPEQVRAYFQAPGSAQRLTPPFFPLRVEQETASLQDTTAVLDWSSPLPGPLGRIRASSRIEGTPVPEGQELTVVSDKIHSRIPRSLAHRILVFRHRRLAADIAALSRIAEGVTPAARTPLTVGITGASGLVGTQLAALLKVAGHNVIQLARGTAAAPDQRHWDPADPAPDLLAGIDVLVHLAGASIAGRFTSRHIDAIRDSRIGPTRALAELVALRGGATSLVCASAIGIYGASRPEEELDETADRGTGVLADIVCDWEAACAPARTAGARVVSVRTGVVLTASGGMLGALAPLFGLGLGGQIGSGTQHLSWISLDDLLDVYMQAVTDPGLSGIVNAVAPSSVTNSEFTRTMAQVMRRPAVCRVPRIGPAILLGRTGAREVALADQNVIPGVLKQRNHSFRHSDLPAALRHELGREQVADGG